MIASPTHSKQLSSVTLVNIWRLGPLMVMCMHWLGLLQFDSLITTVWSGILKSSFFQDPMAEAYVAALSFYGWIMIWSLVDAIPGLACIRMDGFERDTKPLHVMVASNVLGWTTFFVLGEPFGRLVPFWLASMSTLCGYSGGTVGVIRAHNGMATYVARCYVSFFGYLAGIYILLISKGGPAPSDIGSITFGRLTAEVLFGVVAYDFIFAWVHYGMHKFPTGAALGHKQHHNIGFSDRVIAADTIVHAPLDFALQVLVNIIVQNIWLFDIPKHKMSRFLHNIIVTGLLVESHAGYDMLLSTHRLFPGILGGAQRHLQHHKLGKHFYQQFFCYLDDWVLD